jgi:DNA repair exonuclease SbcCD ATPase subunit
MDEMSMNLQGLTFERLSQLLKLETNYENLCNELKEKEEKLKEINIRGTIKFEYGDSYHPTFRETVMLTDQAVEMLTQEIEMQIKRIEELEKDNDRLERLERKYLERIEKLEKSNGEFCKEKKVIAEKLKNIMDEHYINWI